MAVIDFRGWRIQSDESGWAFGKPKTRMNKKQELEIYLDKPRYYNKLEYALQGIIEMELRQSDASNVQEVLELLKTLRQEVMEMLAVEAV